MKNERVRAVIEGVIDCALVMALALLFFNWLISLC